MVKKLKPGKCGQTAGLIGTNFGALMQIHLERVVGPNKLAGGLGLGGGGGGGGGSEIQKSEKHVNTHMHIHLQRVVGQLGGGGGGGSVGRGGG